MSRGSAAFTLPEMMVTMAVFLVMISATIAAHLYGIRMVEFIRPKLDANDQARNTISRLIEEVRCASKIKVGTGGAGSFTEVAPNTMQVGTAIEIYPTVSGVDYIRYFRDASDATLKRKGFGTNASPVAVIVGSVTNQFVFTAEDYTGAVLTNNQNNNVIGMILQIDQNQSTNGYRRVINNDYYQVRTAITRRML
jgi:prepilin-type N-terminal cleavage/methylation domain-containing protein